MKKNVLFLTLVALFMCSTAFGQILTKNPNAYKSEKTSSFAPAKVKSANYFKLGLCTNEFDQANGLGVGSEATEILAMAKLGADFVSPYEGATIAGVNVGFTNAVAGDKVKDVTVFLRETDTGANIASKLVSAVVPGWNQVVFDTPVTLENKNYYIGYHIPILPQATYAIGFTDETAAAQEAMMLSINNGELEDYTDYFGALAVQMLLSGSVDLLGNKVEITEVGIAMNQPVNTVLDIPVKFRNYGINDITSLEVTYRLGTNEPVKQTLTVNAPAGSDEATLTLNDVTINMSGDFTVSINKVNDVEVSVAPVTMTVKAFDPATTAERKVLLEQFTTEKCGICPSGAALIKSIIERTEFAGKVIWVAHHAGYYTDSYTIPASEKYLRFFGSEGSYAPAMMLDRTVFDENVPVMGIGNKTSIINYFRQAVSKSTPISLKITQANTVDINRKVKITVSGNNKSDTPLTEDLYVYIFLLENGIKTTSQSGADGTYTHNNLIRSAMNGVGGTKITWTGNDFSVTSEATLTPGWNAQNMDVVAFVAKNYQNALNNVKVLNAAKEKLVINSGTAVDNVYGENLRVYANNGTIIVDGEYTSINIHSIDGKEFSNNNLPKGIYIVKLENKGQNAVKKVIVQ